ncbi:MAG: AraC family transcriptional regulator [Synergistaceae bacterium]|nr:AraC family transcriptional regulator [Synergistaceae bacterium]
MSDKEKAVRKLWRRKALRGIDFLTAKNLLAARASSHLHHGYTISIVEDGVLPMTFREFKLNLKPGDFLLLGPEVPHGFNFSSNVGGCSYRTVFVKEDYLSDDLRQNISAEAATISCFSDHALWEDYLNIQRGVEAGSQSDIDGIIRSSERLLSHMPDCVLSRMVVKSSHILAVKEYLKENYASAPNIEALAEIAHISPFYLMRLFKEEIGLSPHAYINQLRVNKAKEMMAEGLPLLQITYELGFTDQSHFSKTFLRITGVNPARYGNMKRESHRQ